jgi:hypothetical protein
VVTVMTVVAVVTMRIVAFGGGARMDHLHHGGMAVMVAVMGVMAMMGMMAARGG